MKVCVVYEYAVIAYEERFRIMGGVFSDEDQAGATIREYEKEADDSCEYQYEEFELNKIWED